MKFFSPYKEKRGLRLATEEKGRIGKIGQQWVMEHSKIEGKTRRPSYSEFASRRDHCSRHPCALLMAVGTGRR